MSYTPFNTGTYNATPPTLTTGQTSSVQLDANGNQKVAVVGTVPVSGTVAVTGAYQSTQPVSIASPVAVTGTFYQATQPVSGTVGVSGSVAVTGTFWQATQPVSGTVGVSNTSFGVSGDVAIINSTTSGKTKLAVTADPITFASAQHVVVDSATLGTVAVSGTFWQATQPVSGTVTANAGTGTFAVSAASLPLPTGAATSAKQPALGTAGTASADVITVQGIASMTALKVDGSAVTQPVSGTFWQATQPVSGTVAVSNSFALDATLTGGTQKTKLVDSAGTNLATISAGGALKVDASATTQPVSGTFWQATQPVSLASVPSHAVTNAGTFAVQAAATLAAETTKVIGVVRTADGSGNLLTSTASALDVNLKTSAATVNTVTLPATSGGLSFYSAQVNATKAAVKASAGQIYGYHFLNTTAAIAYVQIFNVASGSVTVGTTTPDLVIPLPGNSTTGAGATLEISTGIAFSTAITLACTTTRGGSTGAAVDCVIYYK